MTPVQKAVLAFALVAGAGPAGFLIYHVVFANHPLQPRITSPEALSPGSSSAPASSPGSGPQLPATTQVTPALPTMLPVSVTLPDSNGARHSLGEYRGRPLVLNFWATWCEPCRREIPLLQSLHESRGSSVQIVGVAVDFQADVLKYAQARHISYPLLMGEKDGLAAVNALGMDTAFPFTVFTDARGDIIAVKRGELHADEAALILGQVGAVDSGRLNPVEARSAVSSGLRNLAIARAQQLGTGSAPAS